VNASNAQKTPFLVSLNRAAEQQALKEIQLTGKALPASVVTVQGAIVTVKFEVQSAFTLPKVTVPIAQSRWLRGATQVGDKGVVIPSDASLGLMSGLGAGVADLSLIANLSALVWVPIGNANWPAPVDANKTQVSGPAGAVVMTDDQTCRVEVTETGVNVFLPAGTFLNVDGVIQATGLQLSGNITAIGGGVYGGNLETSGDIKAGVGTGDQVGLQTHTHQYLKPSTGTNQQTNSPTAGT